MSIKREKQGWQQFLKLCLAQSSEKDLIQFFDALLTSEERHQLALRTELITELLRGDKPQRQIASELGVSIATVTRGSNMLKTVSGRMKGFLMEALA